MKRVILSRRAYLSMLAEVYERVATETGGIFLGHRDGDTWYVLESIEPGPKSVFTPSYFEYDDKYVTYRANKVRRLYESPIELLGLWHRHPSLMKTFSSTDDHTNATYSRLLGGAISGIVTLGNGFEITMYYVPEDIRYAKIECIVDDSQIPKEYLSYYDTGYYEHLINTTAASQYGFEYEGKEWDNEIWSADTIKDSDVDENQSEGSGSLPSAIKKVKDFICSVFELAEPDEEDEQITTEDSRFKQRYKQITVPTVEANNVQQSMTEADETMDALQSTEWSEIAYIFDTIEPEIAYLQKLRDEGKVRFAVNKAKTNQGKEVLILSIKDLRKSDQCEHRLLFYTREGKIVVKNKSKAPCPYTDNYIAAILGGKT